MVERILRRVDALAEFPELGVRTSEADDENVRELVESPCHILYLPAADCWLPVRYEWSAVIVRSVRP